MGSRDKQKRFAAIKEFDNVFEFPEDISGTWHTHVFKNNNPIVLELACGKGEYAVEMARRNPEINYIGVDLKAERIYIGSKTALAEGLTNVVFLRTHIEKLTEYFKPGEVSEIWITFPDPWPRDKQAKRRLTSPLFLALYKQLLEPGSLLHLKTDDPDLFNYSQAMITEAGLTVTHSVADIYAQSQDQPKLPHPLLDITTTFERKHLAAGRKIYYLQCIV